MRYEVAIMINKAATARYTLVKLKYTLHFKRIYLSVNCFHELHVITIK